MKLNFSIIFFFLFTMHQTNAKVVIYTANDGLCNNYVTSIIKDARGLMWVGTRNGLSRYDGYVFTEQPSLQNIGINHLLYDKKRNVIWVGTKEDGLYKIDAGTFSVSHVRVSMLNDKAPVNSMYLHKNGNLYFTFTGDDLIKIDSTDRVSIVTKGEKSFKETITITLINGDTNGNPLFVLKKKDNYMLYALNNDDQHVNIFSDSIKWSFIYRYHQLLICGNKNGSIDFYDIINRKKVSANKVHIPALKELAYMTVQGDYLFAIAKGHDPIQISLTGKETNKIPIENNDVIRYHTSITSLLHDEQGNTWIGSDRGLIKINKSKNSFENVLSSEPPSISTRAIVRDEYNDMYVGTYSGLYHYNSSTQLWSCYKEYFRLGDGEKLITPYALLNDKNGFLYVGGTWGIPFGRFNKKNKSYETIVPYSSQALFQNVYSLIRDTDSIIWLGTDRGLFSYTPSTMLIKAYTDSKYKLENILVKAIKQKNGNTDEIWIGSNNGAYLLNKHKGIISHINTTTTPALSDNEVLSLEEDYQGNLWIGTNGGGINILNISSNSIRYLRKADGLCDNVVYSMLWQDNNRLWVGTSHGLSCYDKTQNAFVNYFMRDGLSDNDFDHNSFYKDPDGRMYFGGINGINAFYPDNLKRSNQPFSLFLSSFSKWDNNAQMFVSEHQLTGNLEKIVMNPYDHSLTFNFALTDYTNSENNTYFFRIKDLYNDWVSLNHQNVLRLDGLNDGTHFIEIKALNASGIPAINTLKFEIVIKQPFYKSIWFYMFIAFCIAGIAYTLFYIKYDNLKKLQTLRIQIASTLHDEMGSLLTRIATFADSVRFSFNSESEKNEKLDKISELSRMANATMNDTLWSIDARNDYTINLIDRMREHAENMLLPRNIEVLFKFDSVSNEQKISPEIRQELILIYKEAINNVAKHGKGDYTKISFCRMEKSYTLTIENDCSLNNIYSHTGSGQGLKNITMRSERIQAKTEIYKHNNIFVLEISKIGNI